MSDTQQVLRLGFIGAGRIAQAHLKAAATLSERVRVVAIAGRRRERAAETARQHGIPTVSEDYRGVLADPMVDAVVVTTPNDSHASIVCDAAKAGKHVLVEKPMALDTRSAETMVRAAEAAGVTLMVAQSRRFSDAGREMVKRLPEIGDIMRAHITFLVSFAQPPTDWWRSSAQAGGLVICSRVATRWTVFSGGWGGLREHLCVGGTHQSGLGRRRRGRYRVPVFRWRDGDGPLVAQHGPPDTRGPDRRTERPFPVD